MRGGIRSAHLEAGHAGFLRGYGNFCFVGREPGLPGQNVQVRETMPLFGREVHIGYSLTQSLIFKKAHFSK